jgi:hypothetical protein
MPRVRVVAAPRQNLPGVWALGVSPRTGPTDPATGVPSIIPGKSGRFFASGDQQEVVVTDDQLKELQAEPNKSLLAVVVIDQSEQPPPEGESMAQPNQPTQPGTTVPPGTSPTPTTTPPAPQGPTPTGEPTPTTPRRAR